MQQALSGYPNPQDLIVAQIKKALNQEQNIFKKQEAAFLKKNANTWAGSMVQNTPYYFTNPTDDWRIQDQNRNNNYWNAINTTNPLFINSPLYTEHILKYLQYYMNPEMHFDENEMTAGLKKSVDTIMKKFGNNNETQKFALKYLQLGFKEIGNEKVLQYLDQNYKELAAQCQDETEKAASDKRMAGYAAMKEGVVAPNITFSNATSLYDIQSEKTLVVFWASWCPHCNEEMPKINSWAAIHPEIKAIAISLDKDKTTYETAIKQYPNLFHNTDLKNWDGQAVKDYYIYGTPTFILLDKDKKIVGKYTSFAEIEQTKNN